jgi:ABC-2 type transport system permease protein
MTESSAPRNIVPNSIAQVGITMKYTFLDYLRSRRFAILLTIMLIISAILTIVVAHYRPAALLASPLSFYSTFWGSFATFLVALSAIFFGGDAIAGEFQNKTGYFTIPNPVRRSSVYIGKWVSAFIAASIILVIFVAITISNEQYYFPGSAIPWQFGESFLFAWFYLIAALGFTFFFSSFFKTTSYAILVSALLLLVAFGIIETLVQDLAQIEPWFILSYGAEIVGNVLMSPYPKHVTTITGAFGRGGAAAPTFTSYNVTIPEGLAIIAAYFAITAVLGLVLFERKEFN